MGNWNLGSVADEIFNLVDDIPTSISGTSLLNMIDQRRLFMESYLGKTIGSTAIEPKYQGPLTLLSQAKLLTTMNTQGTDADSVKLGEFTIKKGGATSSLSSAQALEENAMNDLVNLKGEYNYFKALG